MSTDRRPDTHVSPQHWDAPPEDQRIKITIGEEGAFTPAQAAEFALDILFLARAHGATFTHRKTT